MPYKEGQACLHQSLGILHDIGDLKQNIPLISPRYHIKQAQVFQCLYQKTASPVYTQDSRVCARILLAELEEHRIEP